MATDSLPSTIASQSTPKTDESVRRYWKFRRLTITTVAIVLILCVVAGTSLFFKHWKQPPAHDDTTQEPLETLTSTSPETAFNGNSVELDMVSASSPEKFESWSESQQANDVPIEFPGPHSPPDDVPQLASAETDNIKLTEWLSAEPKDSKASKLATRPQKRLTVEEPFLTEENVDHAVKASSQTPGSESSIEDQTTPISMNLTLEETPSHRDTEGNQQLPAEADQAPVTFPSQAEDPFLADSSTPIPNVESIETIHPPPKAEQFNQPPQSSMTVSLPAIDRVPESAADHTGKAAGPDSVGLEVNIPETPILQGEHAPLKASSPSGEADTQTSRSVAQPPTTFDYVLTQAETYWSLSQKVYDSPRFFQALAEYHRGLGLDIWHLETGMHLPIPPAQWLQDQYPDKILGATPTITTSGYDVGIPAIHGLFLDEEGIPNYRVQPGDTLQGIAQKVLGRASRWMQLYEMNREILATDKPLKVGMILRLPRDATLSAAQQPASR